MKSTNYPLTSVKAYGNVVAMGFKALNTNNLQKTSLFLGVDGAFRKEVHREFVSGFEHPRLFSCKKNLFKGEHKHD